ncbi:hypothetical protein RhiJN_14275 [Ceratobasidium sp. AG-Ba]|nr:hypothetical protein RhiJN_14275 [Ceratobasidium sp. AG-Ba]QRW14826.1 hypothetical protein RhiLY_13825 [Ceratobasidium sp. AG-Ba]
MELFTVFSATFLIGMRVHILWDNRRSIFNLVSIAWILHVVANLVLIALFSVANNAKSYKVEHNFNICMGGVVDSWTVWIPVMLYHCFIMGLLVIKSLSTPRTPTTRIHQVMIRDGFNYFFVVFLALLFNLLSWALGPPTLAALPRFFVWAVCTTATSRLLLSLDGIRSAEEWDEANNITRRDVDVPRRRVQFMFAEHDDDMEISRQHSGGHLKMTTLGRYED